MWPVIWRRSSKQGEVVAVLDRFLGHLLETADYEDTMLIITSDHGNLEDISHRDHTLNNVPALILGRSEIIEKAERLKDIAGIVGLIKAFFCFARMMGMGGKV